MVPSEILDFDWLEGSGADFEIQSRMDMTLTIDHRSVDGATASEFLATVKSFLEEPGLAL